jgi:hypothetical protein
VFENFNIVDVFPIPDLPTICGVENKNSSGLMYESLNIVRSSDISSSLWRSSSGIYLGDNLDLSRNILLSDNSQVN